MGREIGGWEREREISEKDVRERQILAHVEIRYGNGFNFVTYIAMQESIYLLQ